MYLLTVWSELLPLKNAFSAFWSKDTHWASNLTHSSSGILPTPGAGDSNLRSNHSTVVHILNIDHVFIRVIRRNHEPEQSGHGPIFFVLYSLILILSLARASLAPADAPPAPVRPARRPITDEKVAIFFHLVSSSSTATASVSSCRLHVPWAIQRGTNKHPSKVFHMRLTS